MRRQRPSSNQYFAGFDLSLTGTGIVILDSGGNTLERHIIKPKTKGAERLSEIHDTVRSIIAPWQLTLVCIEDYAMGIGTGGKTFQIGELGGVIRVLLYRRQIEYIAPKATQLKKFATGCGGGDGGSKDQVTMHVFKNWGFQAKDNNEADAYVLARIAMGLKGYGEHDLLHQKEVIKVILNPPPPKKKKKQEE